MTIAPEAPAPVAEPKPQAQTAPATRSINDLLDLIPGLKVAKTTEFGLPSSMAFMGDGGTGKTTLLGSIIKVPRYRDAKVAYVDVEDGTKVWANDPVLSAAVKSGQITVFQIDRTNPLEAKPQIDKLLGFKDERGQKNIGALFSPAFGFDVVGVDTFDTLHEIGFEYFSATTLSADGTKSDTQGAYGKLATWSTNILWELQLKKPLGLIASHAMEKNDKKTGTNKTTMKLSGSAKEVVAGIPDLVAYLTWQEAEGEPGVPHLVAHTGRSAEVTTKNRWNIEDSVWDVTMPKLFDVIEQKIAPAKTTKPAKIAA